MPRERVAVYVVRTSGGQRQLLVFDHVQVPDSGTQVPAGGIQLNESSGAAAVREVFEETGVRDVEVLEVVGTSELPYPDTGAPRRTTYVHCATSTTRDDWHHRVTGDGEDDGMLLRCWFQRLPLEDALLADHQDEFLRQL